jgi:hypothetical protein
MAPRNTTATMRSGGKILVVFPRERRFSERGGLT